MLPFTSKTVTNRLICLTGLVLSSMVQFSKVIIISITTIVSLPKARPLACRLCHEAWEMAWHIYEDCPALEVSRTFMDWTTLILRNSRAFFILSPFCWFIQTRTLDPTHQYTHLNCTAPKGVGECLFCCLLYTSDAADE